MRRRVPRRERGAALLAVLLLVAVTGAIAAAAMEKVRLSRLVAQNVASIGQARAFARGAEQLAMLTIDDLIARDPDRTTGERLDGRDADDSAAGRRRRRGAADRRRQLLQPQQRRRGRSARDARPGAIRACCSSPG